MTQNPDRRGCTLGQPRIATPMAASLKLLPGSAVRWRGRRYLIVHYEHLDAIIARQPGKRRLERIPVNEAAPDHASHIVSAWTPDLASVPEEAWQKAVKRFKILKPLLNMGNSERTFAHIKKAARALGKHPATVYRWIENYGRSERLSVFLRKERSDRGARRLSNKVEKIIDATIKKIYLTAERPDVAAVVEERVAEIAEKRGVPRVHIALAWLLQKKPVTAPIIGATKITHLEAAIGALSMRLTTEEVAYLEEPYAPHPIVGHQ